MPSQIAQDQLRADLLGLLIGNYEGTYSGDDNGNWSITVDAEGNLTGSGESTDAPGTPFDLSGTVSSTGEANFATGNVSTGATFSGTIERDGTFSGTWENTALSESGTFSGSIVTAPPDQNDEGIADGGTVTSDPNLNAGIDVFNTITADFAAYESSDITLNAPLIAENGAVVPITVEFPSAAGTLWIFVDSNDEKIAAKVDYLAGNDNGLGSVRLKMKDSGNIIAAFVNDGGNIIATRAFVQVTIGSSPQSCGAPPADCQAPFENIIRARASNGELKMLFAVPMQIENYISTVTLSADSTVFAIAYFTPYISKNPYLAVNHPSAAQQITIEVEATGSRFSSETISGL